jgi:uncharacterized protein YbaP (TraB family)
MIKTIRRLGLVLTICLVLFSSCSPVVETDKQTKSFLWEVSSDVNTIYILGSIHVAKADLYPLGNAIEGAYERSDHVVVEVDITKISDEEMAILLIEKGTYPSGESLETQIPEEIYSRLAERLSELDPSGLLLQTMNSFEPWVIAIGISDFDYMELGYDAEYGIDLYFLNKALEDDKDILELESAEFQFDLFDSLSDELQIMMLEYAVYNPITEEEMEGIFNAWSSGNSEEMEQIIFSEIEEYPEYQILYEKIMDERNFIMVDKIEGFLEDDVIHFIVVGAGHLVGDNGIINLLTESGYVIKQL